MSIEYIVGLILALAIGLFIGFMFAPTKYDGEIILDKNENGEDRIIWHLGMEYEQISEYKKITFKVVNRGT